MNTVQFLDSQLSPYLARGTRSSATTTLAMLNITLPVIYAKGNYIPLVHEIELDATSGYVFLSPEDKAIITASLQEEPMAIHGIDYQTRRPGVGRLVRPVGSVYGLIDRGLFPIKSEIPTDGIDELIFTCESASFAGGDSVTVTYRDSVNGYTQVVLPLNTISTSIASAATYASGAETSLAVTSSAGILTNFGVTISGASDSSYNGTWRVTAIPDGTHIAINKPFVAGAITGTIATNQRIQPASTIASVISILFTGLPGTVQVADEDGIIYAELIPGSGVSSYRRYECPQVPEDATEDDEWIVRAVAKRAFIPLTASTDIVYMDSIPALTEAFLATVARDNADMERYNFHWKNCFDILSSELYDEKGGVTQFPTMQLWGDGIHALDSRF